METTTRVSRRKQLTPMDEAILEQYSRGESYEVIQLNLYNEYGVDLSKRALGEEMGNIKRKMRCQTQFQMGCLYTSRAYGKSLLKLSEAHEKQLLAEKKRKYAEGYETGYDYGTRLVRNYSTGQDLNKGLKMGIVFSTIFWLAVFGIISNTFL